MTADRQAGGRYPAAAAHHRAVAVGADRAGDGPCPDIAPARRGRAGPGVPRAPGPGREEGQRVAADGRPVGRRPPAAAPGGTQLRPLLAERGVVLSREQVYRLVTGVPERLSLATLAALCDILGCGPGDLVEPVAGDGAGGRPVSGPAAAEHRPVPRPVRARVSGAACG